MIGSSSTPVKRLRFRGENQLKFDNSAIEDLFDSDEDKETAKTNGEIPEQKTNGKFFL